jgi:cellobiose-specific phosphotransferase system component IIA
MQQQLPQEEPQEVAQEAAQEAEEVLGEAHQEQIHQVQEEVENGKNTKKYHEGYG